MLIDKTINTNKKAFNIKQARISSSRHKLTALSIHRLNYIQLYLNDGIVKVKLEFSSVRYSINENDRIERVKLVLRIPKSPPAQSISLDIHCTLCYYNRKY